MKTIKFSEVSDPSKWSDDNAIKVGDPLTEEWLDRIRWLMGAFNEAKGLLVEAEVILERYWFSDHDGESYNNDDVIEMDEKIKKWLKESGPR